MFSYASQTVEVISGTTPLGTHASDFQLPVEVAYHPSNDVLYTWDQSTQTVTMTSGHTRGALGTIRMDVESMTYDSSNNDMFAVGLSSPRPQPR